MKNFTPSDPEEKPLTLNDKQKAVIATAEAYLLRGEKLQYDDSRFGSTSATEYRWQVGYNAPEDVTSGNWGYTNCAAFTYDVYLQALGYTLPSSMFTTNALVHKSPDYNMRVYYYERAADSVQSAEEKAKVQKEFTEALVPGDIMVILRGSYGHAMLYIGNGTFIHSTGSSYSYTSSTGYEQYEPTVRYHRIMDYFFNESSKGYVFGPVTHLAIVRPLDVITGEIPQSTQNRMANMQGVMAQKLASHSPAATVNRGEEMTFTFEIFNTNTKSVKLDVHDSVPANAVYVGGAQKESGGKLSWTVEIPAGERVSLSYKVKVRDDAPYGGEIVSESTVGGIAVNCPAVQIRRTLTEAEQKALVDAVKALRAEGSKLASLELVNEIYKRALGVEKIFTDTDFAVITRGEEGIFQNYTVNGTKQQAGGKDVYTTHAEGKYWNLLAPTLYGGYRLHTEKYTFERVRLPKEHDLIPGDIILGKTSSSESIVMYIGEDICVSMKADMPNDSVGIDMRLERLHGYAYYYAILRPSMALEG